MTTASAKGMPMRKDKKSAVTAGKNNADTAAIILIALLAGIPFLLGRYFEFNYPDPFDSASNVYSAQHILNGARIGIDENPSASLGTLLVNMLGVRLFGFSEFGPKLIQTVIQAAALVLMFVAMRRMFGKLPAAVGVIVAAIYTSSPLIAKFGNVKEQYMIACMVMAVSLFVLRQLGGKWWLGFLAGAIAAWAPLFKETGVSAIGAMALFVIAQPIFKHRTWKQTGVDIMLLLAGAAVSMAPLYIWIIGWKVQMALPFYFVWDAIAGLIPKPAAAQQAGNYVSSMRDVMPFSGQWPKVLRYYLALCLPVSLALGAIISGLVKMILGLRQRSQSSSAGTDYDRFLLLLAIWWLLDMAFVWISPASYEQYYLPLTVSGAMTGGYLVAIYRDKLAKAVFKTKWVVTGIAGFVLMVIMSWHIFFGLPRSPYSGTKYPQKRNGYVQRWQDVSQRRSFGAKGYWEQAGEYVRSRTQPTDKIYVWGWVPGIYLSAQRFSSSANAFESEMHTRLPQQLEQVVEGLLGAFGKEMPKYIVDSRKQHLPLDRFKFELWPYVPQGFMGFQKGQFLPNGPQITAEFEKQWGQMTRERFGDDEARRFEIMGKFRKFIREHYEIEQIFGDQVVFKLKT
ncbi:MAG: glycosyltransferase family 39 protein [Planctomycetes bacterium]|nr:glycosyltransferase family 39 protein [Planctomycetota bacterium]